MCHVPSHSEPSNPDFLMQHATRGIFQEITSRTIFEYHMPTSHDLALRLRQAPDKAAADLECVVQTVPLGRTMRQTLTHASSRRPAWAVGAAAGCPACAVGPGRSRPVPAAHTCSRSGRCWGMQYPEAHASGMPSCSCIACRKTQHTISNGSPLTATGCLQSLASLKSCEHGKVLGHMLRSRAADAQMLTCGEIS